MNFVSRLPRLASNNTILVSFFTKAICGILYPLQFFFPLTICFLLSVGFTGILEALIEFIFLWNFDWYVLGEQFFKIVNYAMSKTMSFFIWYNEKNKKNYCFHLAYEYRQYHMYIDHLIGRVTQIFSISFITKFYNLIK